LVSFVAVTFLSGCAPSAQSVEGQYVSPMLYSNYDCNQLEQETRRLGSKVSEITKQQESAAATDAVAMGVGLVLFWPALFFMIGGDKSDELGRLKGEYEALEIAAIDRQCNELVAQFEESREMQEKVEADQDLVEERYQECVDILGKGACSRDQIEREIAKEKQEEKVMEDEAKKEVAKTNN